MSIRIKRLRCRITVASDKDRPLLHNETKPIRPAMVFALPQSTPHSESMPEPAEMATEERGAATGNKNAVEPRQIDPKAVADRVYELMQREVLLARERSGFVRKN